MSSELNNSKNSSKTLKVDIAAGQLLNVLPPRIKKILELRFGLTGSKPKVLGEIGKEMGITRERVRQIEADGFKRLRKAPKSLEFRKVIKEARLILQAGGGFCEKSFLKERLIANPNQIQRNQLMFVLNSSSQLKFYRGNVTLKGFWLDADAIVSKNEIIALHHAILKFLEEQKTPISFEKIWEAVRAKIAVEYGEDIFTGQKGKRTLRRLLLLSRKIKRNILEEWGIKSWRTISERGSREKAYLVLKKIQRPLHFREITEYINRYWKDRQALPQTVHNELIKDQRFVLVGRGVYGLKEWGLAEGTVKDIIVQLLKEKRAEQPAIHRDEIVAYVLSKKKVKRTTVLVNLADKNYFIKDRAGKFQLKKRR